MVKDGVVAMDSQGVVQSVFGPYDERLNGKKIMRFNGILVPGFVNAHCHLELSHMKGKVARNTGLPDFLSTVMGQRGEADDTIQQAMSEMDNIMYDNGIQAVGDHVNTAVSAQVKKSSPMHYHTFVEMLGMVEADAQQKIDHARDVEYHFGEGRSSITPHAPYSCSTALFKRFARAVGPDNTISIHNQESEEENKLFRHKEGRFIDFYEKNNIPYQDFRSKGRSSLQWYTPLLPRENRLILVHNTFTSFKDLHYMNRRGYVAYYCLCPKANLYIEGRLPRISDFLASKQKIVMGTDSLASNDTLDILEELKVIHRELPDLSMEEMLRWVTLNGAEALGMESFLGSLDKGKKPGLLLLEEMDGLHLTDNARVRRIV